MDLTLWLVVFVVSLSALVKSSDYFTGAAEKIGLMAGLSPFVVGVTIVSIGTSLPELISSVIAVYSNASEIVAGNVIGSNVANIFLIMAIGAIVGKRLRIHHNLLPVDLPILIGSALFLGVTVMDKVFTFGEACIFVCCMLLFMAYTVNNRREQPGKNGTPAERAPFRWRPIIVLVLSGFMVFLGAKYTIESIIKISQILNIGSEVIAVTAVAFGTSLPELAVTFAAVKKDNAEIIVGNVLGSNIFNTFAVMGVPGLISTLHVSDMLLFTGIPVMIVASLLFLVVIVDRRMSSWEGWFFILFYVYFIGKIFNLL